MEGCARTLNRLVDPERRPAFSRLMASGVLWGTEEPDHEFRFGLERVLDGIDALVRERGRGRRPGRTAVRRPGGVRAADVKSG
ncbi:TetR/AcrR family transcriptional regulator C-terminal domain-containing protein [Streptomyces brevispora]|uniref:TetR/AcrR family transcriptional regulator C-terminal domain-containing protein n=1 Tax=Streptomyces brevispora TaxID=887462 RepID=UPI0033C4A179